MEFILDEKLAKDCILLGNLKLCKLLLMNDRQYPWLILVPRREDIKEIYQLERDDLISLQIESNIVSKMLVSLFTPDKLNIAALGNIVPQLHIHHIARFTHDACWPKPVWGQLPPIPYGESELKELTLRMIAQLGNQLKVPKIDARL